MWLVFAPVSDSVGAGATGAALSLQTTYFDRNCKEQTTTYIRRLSDDVARWPNHLQIATTVGHCHLEQQPQGLLLCRYACHAMPCLVIHCMYMRQQDKFPMMTMLSHTAVTDKPQSAASFPQHRQRCNKAPLHSCSLCSLHRTETDLADSKPLSAGIGTSPPALGTAVPPACTCPETLSPLLMVKHLWPKLSGCCCSTG